jgi:gas vesicle protein
MMAQSSHRGKLDNRATVAGILMGLMVGAIYAILHIQNRGETTRKNLTQFGAGSLEASIDSSLDDAKRQAHQRLNESD